MTQILSQAGYEQTRAKLADMEKRLAELGKRGDLSPIHLAEVRRSYQTMIRQYRRELKLYEATQPRPPASSPQ
jgi:hypothetical protein